MIEVFIAKRKRSNRYTRNNEYRKGYCHGYTKALNNMESLYYYIRKRDKIEN